MCDKKPQCPTYGVVDQGGIPEVSAFWSTRDGFDENHDVCSSKKQTGIPSNNVDSGFGPWEQPAARSKRMVAFMNYQCMNEVSLMLKFKSLKILNRSELLVQSVGETLDAIFQTLRRGVRH